MTTSSRTFSSKILLFGEYSIILNSHALSLPFPLFDGRLTFRKDNSGAIDGELRALVRYLKNEIPEMSSILDLSSLEFDVSQGLYFESTIPQGFGVGSSGALVAAIYDRYKLFSANFLEMKKIFMQMESHFHGSSSGVDPLISYLNCPIYFENKNELKPIELPVFEKSNRAIFLLNTSRSRKTEPLVNLFLEKIRHDDFKNLCTKELIPITNNCIAAYLQKDVSSLWTNFEKLSHFQFQHFSPMIPKLYHHIWEDGLSSRDYFIKLCGAGGGGFLMGITSDVIKVKNTLQGHDIRPVLYF